jgi:4-methylaminobutanoate oxidase (formaldehyde-forming)
MPDAVPERAQVVIIGGGVIGLSIAYHLTHQGWTDVLLLERHQLTSGTTWHAAGLITSAGMTDEASLTMSIYSRELYARLEDETGLSTGFRRCGHLHVATTATRVEAMQREAAYAKRFGQESHEIGPDEIAKLWPMAETSDLLRGFYVPIEGRANPYDVAMSLAKGARQGGATILEGVPVTGITRRADRVTGVVTDLGVIETEVVVLAAGIWSRQFGDTIGVRVPLQAAEHYYLITEPFDGVHPDLPVLEDPSTYGYFREETGGLLVGLFEPQAAAWQPGSIPDDFAFGEIEPDWERISPFVDLAMSRVPAVRNVGVRKFFCGPESFTADVHPLLGESPELRGLFTATGLNSLGILLGGGVGNVMAEWIVSGQPPIDLTGFTLDRASPHEATPKFRRDRTPEQLGVLFGDAVAPGWTPRSARGIRRSPVHERLVSYGARFDTTTGWEWADFFAGRGTEAPPVTQSFQRQGHWSLVEAEHRAVREDVGLLDMSFMCKFLLQGRDAGPVLDRLVVSEAAHTPIGKVVYTAICHEGGGMWADCTFTRLAEDRYMVIGTDLVTRRLEALLRRGVTEDDNATMTDVTAGHALFSVQGPKSRELLSRLTSADLSNESFPYLSGRYIDVAYAPSVWVQRVTYVGELGYELHVRADLAVSVYDALFEAGDDLGLRNVGMSALNGLRIEKGYRDYGHDIGNDDTPLEAGIGFVVDYDKGDFPGRQALVKQREGGPLTERLVNVLVLDAEPLLFHGEDVLRNGVLVGEVEAGAFGYTLGGSVAIATVRCEDGVTGAWLSAGTFEVEVSRRRYPARVQLGPLYDPSRSRILA